MVDPEFIDIQVSKCLRIASRSEDNSKMYIAESKCVGFGTKAMAMLSLGSIVGDVSFYVLGNKALREQVCNLCLNTISYSALVMNENPAFAVHKRSGHPSRDTMKTILEKGLINNPGYTMKDLQAWTEPCHGCEMGKTMRQPHSGTHSIQDETRADVIIY